MADYRKETMFWIKITDHFFTSDTVDFLMSQENGANYIVIYQMICLKTVNSQGILARQMGDFLVPYDVDKLTRDLKWFNRDTIIVALGLFARLGLIKEESNGTLYITNYEKLVAGSTTEGAYKKEQQRIRANTREEISFRKKNVENSNNNIFSQKNCGKVGQIVDNSLGVDKLSTYDFVATDTNAKNGENEILANYDTDSQENGEKYTEKGVDKLVDILSTKDREDKLNNILDNNKNACAYARVSEREIQAIDGYIDLLIENEFITEEDRDDYYTYFKGLTFKYKGIGKLVYRKTILYILGKIKTNNNIIDRKAYFTASLENQLDVYFKQMPNTDPNVWELLNWGGSENA